MLNWIKIEKKGKCLKKEIVKKWVFQSFFCKFLNRSIFLKFIDYRFIKKDDLIIPKSIPNFLQFTMILRGTENGFHSYCNNSSIKKLGERKSLKKEKTKILKFHKPSKNKKKIKLCFFKLDKVCKKEKFVNPRYNSFLSFSLFSQILSCEEYLKDFCENLENKEFKVGHLKDYRIKKNKGLRFNLIEKTRFADFKLMEKFFIFFSKETWLLWNFYSFLLKLRYKKFRSETKKKMIQLKFNFTFFRIFFVSNRLVFIKAKKEHLIIKFRRTFQHHINYLNLELENGSKLSPFPRCNLDELNKNISTEIFRTFFFKSLKKNSSLYLLEISNRFKKMVKKGFFFKQKYCFRIIVKKNKTKKRVEKITSKKSLLIFLFKTGRHTYLFSDEDFVFGFLINFCKKLNWKIHSLEGFVEIEKIGKKKNCLKKKKKEITGEEKKTFLAIYDLVLFTVFRKKYESLLEKPNLIAQTLNTIQIQNEELNWEDCDFFVLFKNTLNRMWYNGIQTFTWILPHLNFWSTRKSLDFHKKLLNFFVIISAIGRKVHGNAQQRKKREKSYLNLGKERKKKKKSKNKKTNLKKKLIQRKKQQHQEKIHAVNVSKRKIYHEIICRQKSNVFPNNIKQNIYSEIREVTPIPWIQGAIRKLEFFKRRPFDYLSRKSIFFSKKLGFSKNTKNTTGSMLKLAKLTEGKVFLKSFLSSLSINVIFRLGFFFLPKSKPTLFFLGYKFIFCFLSFPIRGKLFSLRFIYRKKKKIVAKKTSCIIGNQFNLSRSKISEPIEKKSIGTLCRAFFKKKKKSFLIIFIKALRYFYGKTKIKKLSLPYMMSHGVKEVNSSQLLLFFGKNDKKFLYRHFFNYISYGIDFFCKMVFHLFSFISKITFIFEYLCQYCFYEEKKYQSLH